MSLHKTRVHELLTKIEKQKHTYGSVLVSCFLHRDEITSPWTNIITLIVPLSKNDPAPDPARLAYGNLMLLKTIITIDELIELIKELPEKTPAELKIGDLTISVQGELDSGYKHFPQNNYLFVNIKWGYEVFQYRKDKNPIQSIGYDPIVSVDLPLYPNYKYVLKDFIGINPTSYA